MQKKIIAIITICLLIDSFALNVFSVSTISNIVEIDGNAIQNEGEVETENKTLQEQIDEVEQKINTSNNMQEYVQGEMSETLQKVIELQDNQDQYQGRYNELQSQIVSLTNQINETKQKLADIQERYDKKEKVLKKKVVALYESGETSYLELILSSKNIVEFLSNYFLVSELIEYDNNLLDEMNDTRNQIEKTKKEQEEQENVLREAREEIIKTQILIENTNTIQKNYVLKLSSKEREIQKQIEEYKKEQLEIENKISAALNWAGTFSIQFTNGYMIWPVAMDGTYITSGYGIRRHPIQGVYKKHAGIDISASGIYGAPVVAAADGIVIFAGVMGGYGNCVMVSHGNGLASLYGHGSEIIAVLGQTVRQGEIIMKVGSTGNSTGPHLHFEVRKDGVATDPIPYLNGQPEGTNNVNNNNGSVVEENNGINDNNNNINVVNVIESNIIGNQ